MGLVELANDQETRRLTTPIKYGQGGYDYPFLNWETVEKQNE
jgi:hypothetical protein